MSCSVEDLVSHITNYSSRKEYTLLNDFMNQHYQLLLKNQSLHDLILEALNVQRHSLGVLHIMAMKASCITSQSSLETVSQLMQQMTVFMSQCCQDQLNLARGCFANIFHHITHLLCERKIPIRGIKLMCLAIDTLQNGEPSSLTSVHADLCQLCLAAKCFKPALKYIDVEISKIDKECGMMTAFHLLSYYYYGGMVYTAMKRYDRALYFYEQAVTCPATMVSMIMTEAYKKYVLVSLILEGKLIPLPRYTSSVTTRWIKNYMTEYQELATEYGKGSATQLNALVSRHNITYTQDHNMGLVKQVAISLDKRNIQKLTKTFITLSLEDVVMRAHLNCNIEQLEKLLLKMIAEKEIFAGIDQQSKMVKFYDNPEQYNSCETLESIDKHVQNFMDIDNKIKEMNQAVMVNPLYLHKVKSSTSPHDEEFEAQLSQTASTSSSSAPRSSALLSKLNMFNK